MNELRWVDCGVCEAEVVHEHPDDRKCIPFYNGEPTTSIAEHDCYRFACAKCYQRWVAMDDRAVQNLSRKVKVEDLTQGINLLWTA